MDRDMAGGPLRAVTMCYKTARLIAKLTQCSPRALWILEEAALLLSLERTKEKVEQQLIDPVLQGRKAAELNLLDIEELRKKGAWDKL